MPYSRVVRVASGGVVDKKEPVGFALSMRFEHPDPGYQWQSRAQQVSHLIMTAIVAEGLQPGDSLPSEAQLAAGYGVSRSLIREAIRGLDALGVVQVRNGRGAVVRPLDPQLLQLFLYWAMSIRETDLIEILELRKGIEAQSMRLAARRTSTWRNAELLKLVAQLDASVDDVDQYLQVDLQLHSTIARMADNRLILLMVGALAPFTSEAGRQALQALPDRREAAREMLGQTKVVVQAIVDRAGEDARRSADLAVDWMIQRVSKERPQLYAGQHSGFSEPLGLFRNGRMLQAETPITLSEQISRDIIAMIVTQGLRPTDLLPTESELAEQYGVSRGVVREALRALAALSMVQVQTGRRAMVKPFSTELLSTFLDWAYRLQEITLIEIHELRKGIEGQAAALAAARSAPQERAELEDILGSMGRSSDDAERYGDLDLQFHLTLGRASGNRLLGHVVASFQEVIRDVIRQGLDSIANDPRRRVRMQRGHERIVDAVRRGDRREARLAVERSADRTIARVRAASRYRALAPIEGG